MLQRDYIMRLLQQFFEALEKLVEERDKKVSPELLMIIGFLRESPAKVVFKSVMVMMIG